MKNIIELKNISKTYHLGKTKLEVLKNVNLSIENGEFVAIMGPSGSGKSTMLHMIGCLDKPTSGKTMISGKSVENLSDDELSEIRNKKIGFVFQFFYLIPSLNVINNIILPMSFNGIPKEEREARSKRLLKMVGLSERMYHMPSQLSGGERQRVAIARAMANNPEIILADEPTGNLDSKSGKDIMDILKSLRDEGNTVVMITHDKNIADYAERIIHIKDGQVSRANKEKSK